MPRTISADSLTGTQSAMISTAEEAREKAFNPFSHFYVGAALHTLDGNILPGANYESASYGLTICAERSALVGANERGHRLFDSIAISTRGETFSVEEPIAPCGACRQLLYEASKLADIDMDVILASTDRNKIVIARISELLPMAFSAVDLGIDLTKYIRR
jgi:cytidine deaminase